MKLPGIREDEGFRIYERVVKFQGKVVGVSVDHIRLPSGHVTHHEVIHLPSAVTIVPLLEEEGRRPEVVLVEQFRNSVEGYIHELPAGVLERGEDPALCAARELKEETGYSSSRITHLSTLLPIPGTSGHLMHFFLAEGLAPGEPCLEESECLVVKRFLLEDLVALILGKGRERHPGVAIVDAKTHIGILQVAMLKGVGPG